jgi:DNA-binding CsgD family transcriptional regulator
MNMNEAIMREDQRRKYAAVKALKEQGKTNAEIGNELGIHESTVRFMVGNMNRIN